MIGINYVQETFNKEKNHTCPNKNGPDPRLWNNFNVNNSGCTN